MEIRYRKDNSFNGIEVSSLDDEPMENNIKFQEFEKEIINLSSLLLTYLKQNYLKCGHEEFQFFKKRILKLNKPLHENIQLTFINNEGK